MQKEEFISIVEKVANGTATDEQIAAYLQWYRSFYESADIWTDLKEEPETFKKALLSEIHTGIKHAEQPIRKAKLWRRIASVAAAVAATTLGVWLYNISNTPRHPELVSGPPLAHDIKPGKNTARITLANGKTINLSDTKTGVVVGNELTYNDGSAIANLSPSGRDGVAREGNKVQTLTATTPRGGTYQITLPDGTKVWLNADSKISFPSQFSGEKRKILLINGEAYFEVSSSYTSLRGHRTKQSFIVESAGQQVEVLGTHFNISAYKDEASVKTTLLEGSVRVNNVVIKPNQQATLTDNNAITVKEIDAELAVAWKNNKFVFANQPIEDIMRMVARWYNVEVIYQGPIPDAKFRGSVSRFENVSKVLKMLESTGSAHFKIEGRRIYVFQ